MDNNLMEKYHLWQKLAVDDGDVADELMNMTQAGVEDAFYRDLAFGTGGLRGVIG